MTVLKQKDDVTGSSTGLNQATDTIKKLKEK